MTRIHQPINGACLDRRIIEELFLDAASRFSFIRKDAIGDGVLDRTKFELESFTALYYNYDYDIQYIVPDFAHVPPGSNIVLDIKDSFFNVTVAWSLELIANSANCYFVAAWPVINGEAVWELMDFKQKGPLIPDYGTALPDPFKDAQVSVGFSEDDEISMGMFGSCSGLSGRGDNVIMILGVGDWKIIKSSMSIVQVLR